MAGELNANLSSVKYQYINDELVHNNFAKTTFTVKHSEGISLLPGYFLTDTTLLYGRVGYANGKIKIKESDPSIRSFNRNQGGLRFGLGLKQDLTPKLALRMEYSQINYRQLNSSVYDPVGRVLKDTVITPYTAQVAFGVVYSFDQPYIPTK